MENSYSISAAAKFIGCSRPTLYKYLDQPQYKPASVAGHPTLTATQVKAIKAERDAAKKNGKRPKKKA